MKAVVMKTWWIGCMLMAGLLGTAAADDVVFGTDFIFTGESVSGEVDLESFESKPILIYWGSIKCPRCAAQVKDFARLTRSAEKSGFEVISIQSEDADQKDLEDYIKDHRIEGTFYPSYKSLRYKNDGASLKMLFNGIPRYVVVGADGKVIGSFPTVDGAKKVLRKLK